MSFWPELSLPVQHGFQVLNGLLLLVVVLHLLAPHRRFLLGERWGGFAQTGPVADALHRPVFAPFVLLAWGACAVALILDWHPVFAAAGNVLFCRYYFVAMRWRGIARGFGAPGFMTYWLATAVLWLAVTRRHAPAVQPLALLWLQVDFALIILSSGISKLRSGYARGEGMDFGLVNPMWSYWPETFRRLPTTHPLFRFLNHSAWLSQLASAGLMVVPSVRWLGGVIEFATYVFIATQIRLGWLAEQMMVAALLFFTADSPVGVWVSGHWPLAGFAADAGPFPGWLVLGLQIFLGLQVVLTPLCHAGLWFNFYGRRRLPAPFQRLLDSYANGFGVIIWRVFSVDHLNFHVRIYRAPAGGGERTLVSRWRDCRSLRFWHVGEAIAVTSLFTTLKYYPDDDAIFRERVLRYARTLACPPGDELIFEHVSIQKLSGRYHDRVDRRYHVDPARGTLHTEIVDPDLSPAAAHPFSPVHQAARPGTYAPRAT